MARRLGSVQAGFSSRAKKNPSCSGPGSSCAAPPSARRARRASGVRAANASITASFSSGNTEQVTYSNLPPVASVRQSASRMRAWRAANAAISVVPPQPLDVGMAPRHARCRAGHVGEDAIEGGAVPPGIRARCSRRRAPRPPARAAPGCASRRRSAPRRRRRRERDIGRSPGYARSCRRAQRRHRAPVARPAGPAIRPRVAPPRPAPIPRRRRIPAGDRPAPAFRAAAPAHRRGAPAIPSAARRAA